MFSLSHVEKNKNAESSQRVIITGKHGFVGHQAKMPPMIFHSKDRQKIHDPKKIQDTDDVVRNRDTGGIANRDTLSMTTKIRWKDLKKEEQSKVARGMLVF